MQCRVIFYGRNREIPVDLHRSLHGAIYKALSRHPEYSLELHTADPNAIKPFKGFTFGPLTGETQNVNGHRYLNGYAAVEIRSVDAELITLLTEAWTREPLVQLDWAAVEVAELSAMDKCISTSSACIRMVSPAVAYITQEDKRQVFFSPEEESFYKLIRVNAERKSKCFLGRDSVIDIEPLFTEKPRYERSFFKKTPIMGWYGDFRLTGEPELLTLLYNTGLGAKNSEGFGMFDIIANNG